MFEPGHEFDDGPDDEPVERLLPPEDRLWRHPSEMALYGRPTSEEAAAARRNWLQQIPSRGGAWTAGVVGAVLTTGVVLLGTHLTTWLGPAGGGAARVVEMRTLTAPTTTLAGSLAPVAAPRADEALGQKVASGMALVEGWVDESRYEMANGIVVRQDGMILAPASLAADASGLQVTLSSGQFPASVVGVDTTSNLAVLHVNTEGLRPLQAVATGAPAPGLQATVEWVAKREILLSTGQVTAAETGVSARAGQPALFTALRTTLTGLPAQPLGAAVVNGSGDLVAVVAGRHGEQVVVLPAAVAEQVAAELIARHSVTHGWLGITGTEARGGGVEVRSVTRGGAAALAGIRPGDVIDYVDGQPVRTMGQLQAQLYLIPARQPVSVDLLRRGRLLASRAVLQKAS